MEGNNTTDCSLEEDPSELHVLDNPGVKLALVGIHAGTLLTLCACVKTTYDKVEINHPVFAVVFQGLVILTLCQLIGYISLLFMMVDFIKLWRLIFLAISLSAMQFHQVTWLCVTSIK